MSTRAAAPDRRRGNSTAAPSLADTPGVAVREFPRAVAAVLAVIGPGLRL